MTAIIITVLAILAAAGIVWAAMATKVNDGLREEGHALRCQIFDYERRRGESARAYVSDNEPLCYSVRIFDRGADFEVKRFYFGDDSAYANLCAQELADHINQDY